jgi:hypothetical protein
MTKYIGIYELIENILSCAYETHSKSIINNVFEDTETIEKILNEVETCEQN